MKFALALTLCAAFVLTVAEAGAASCDGLKSELRRLEAASQGASPAARKWQTAKRQQQKAISAAERDARHFGCANAASPECRSLTGKLKRMRANLSAIERQLQKSSGSRGSNTARKIGQIRNQLKKQSCDKPRSTRQANKEKPKQNTEARRQAALNKRATRDLANARNDDALKNQNQGGFFRRFFSMRPDNQPTTARRVAASPDTSNRKKKRSSTKSGAYTSICVRTCDGYFFPLNNSVSKDQLPDDEARCTEICPAAPTELYVFRSSREEPIQMKSLAGQLYTEQPFAFRFRHEYVEGCSCRSLQTTQRRSALTEVSTGSSDRIFLKDISGGLSGLSLRRLQDGFGENLLSPSLEKAPVAASQISSLLDPDTRFNLIEGFNVSADLTGLRHPSAQADTLFAARDNAAGTLPLLSSQVGISTTDVESEQTGPPPVFLQNESEYSPAVDEKKVRVVGPEFFVSQ